MKKLISITLSIILSLSTISSVSALEWGEEHIGETGNNDIAYSDVSPLHWAYEETKRCKEKGWFSGYPDGRFIPDASITRAEAIKVIVNFLGRELEDVRISNYHDVDVNAWYAPYIHAGEDLFTSKWKNSGAFQPDMPMTREDTVYALVVALGYDSKIQFADESVLNMFDDQDSITNTLRPYFAVAVSNELVSGFQDNTIRAQDALTRAQFAALLYRVSFKSPVVKQQAKLQTVQIMPSSTQNLTVGDSFTFFGKAKYSDNSVVDYPTLNPYDSDYSGIVSISGNTITALKAGTCVIKFNCEYTEPTSVTVSVSNPTDAPKIKIFDLTDRTDKEYMELSGTVTDKTGTNVDLRCNGNDIMLNGESFHYRANLNIGKNIFEFIATNEYGTESKKTIEITRDEIKPATVIMENVVGKSESNAKNLIESIGLKVVTETVWDENIPQGTVLKQSINSGEETELGNTVIITVSGGQNAWVGWTDSLPAYVNSSDYIIEEKTQYRYKTLETTTDTSSSKNGWTLINQTDTWGNWSNWSLSSVNSSSTREIETKSVADPQQTKTQWHYTRYYGWDSNKGCYVSWPWQGTHAKTYQESGWLDNPLENRGRADNVNATCYRYLGDSISVWWWNETTRTVTLPTTYHTEYRYRDKTTTYYYSRWTNWSEWKDTQIHETDSQKVETKKVYRYKFK